MSKNSRILRLIGVTVLAMFAVTVITGCNGSNNEVKQMSQNVSVKTDQNVSAKANQLTSTSNSGTLVVNGITVTTEVTGGYGYVHLNIYADGYVDKIYAKSIVHYAQGSVVNPSDTLVAQNSKSVTIDLRHSVAIGESSNYPVYADVWINAYDGNQHEMKKITVDLPY